MSFAESPFLLLAVLFVVSQGIYFRYFRFIHPGTASASIIMAVCIFALEWLVSFNSPAWVKLIFIFALLIAWVYLAVLLLNVALQNNAILRNMADRIAMGTWVTSAALLALLLTDVEPVLYGFIVLLSLLTVILYPIYLCLVGLCYVRREAHMQVMGSLLLVTVSTQTLVLLLNDLFHKSIPFLFYQGLIAAGLIYYFFVLTASARHSLSNKQYFHPSTINMASLVYGAMAISGLAVINTHVFPEIIISIIWWWALGSFVVMSSIDVIRLLSRIKKLGIRKAIFVYDTSQWMRNFSWGAFYAFTLNYYNHNYSISGIARIIASFGQYPVSILLMIEFIILGYYVARVHKLKQGIE